MRVFLQYPNIQKFILRIERKGKIFSCYILATSFLATLRGRGSFYGNKFVDTIFYRITMI